MIQCNLCGYKFDETKVEPCGCNCAFGGCNGFNVRCPNCGFDMPLPKDKRPQNIDKESLLTKIRNSLKQEH